MKNLEKPQCLTSVALVLGYLYGKFMESYAEKLRIIILLQFEVLAFRFAYVRDRSLTCSCFRDF